MDFFFHYGDQNLHSSAVITSSKTFHGRSSSSSQVAGEKKAVTRNHKLRNNGQLQQTNITAAAGGTSKVKLSTDPQSVAARERRHRISDKLKILRSMIPGGDTKNMDTVSMLEEAIRYVKYLKSQIWLHQTTMISFENYNNNNDDDHHHHDNQYYWPHQAADVFTFDHGDYYNHHQLISSSLPKMDRCLEASSCFHHQLSSNLPKMERFSEGSSCYKDNIGSLALS